jgi:subtilisin family serine protease
LNATYNYNWTGSGVRVYIIDTGIRTSHTQFGGRASDVFDAFGGNGQDCNGHGTHVAGTVGGSTYGVAKSSLPRGVRVLDCNGSGSTSGVIAGVDWVRQNFIAPAVANMSLGGGASTALDNAVNALSNAGVAIAVAAGNSNANACNSSPARAANAITTGSTTTTDARSSFSNFGTCVDLFAPGSGILSAWFTSNTATATLSGTSMASPHVAGVAALYKQANPSASATTVRNAIVNNATTNVITNAGTGSPNRLLYSLFF